jgi:hypothetical protein
MENRNILQQIEASVAKTDRTLKVDSLLYSCFVASINRTEDGQPLAVYPGFLSGRESPFHKFE